MLLWAGFFGSDSVLSDRDERWRKSPFISAVHRHPIRPATFRVSPFRKWARRSACGGEQFRTTMTELQRRLCAEAAQGQKGGDIS